VAWTFVEEDGTGLPNATSYVSAAYALDYFEIDPNATAFLDLDATTQEYYLGWATRILDQKVMWNGRAATTTQALAWPRIGVRDRYGVSIGGSVVPREVKDATVEMARWLISNDPTSGRDVENLRRVTVDVIELEWQEGVSQSSLPSLLSQILKGLGQFQSNRGFGKILKV
jgi:hypothetical protein